MKNIKEFFIMHTEYGLIDIYSVKEIHSGYSNNNYLVELKNGQKFQVRISKEINEQRQNELRALSLINDKNFIYFNKRGDAIKKWIDGNTITTWSDELLAKIAWKLKKLHQIKPDGLMTHNYKRRLFMDLHKKYLDIYLKLVKKYENDDVVFSHNDLNGNNIIENNGEPYFIDYEYACANSRYWDLANLINEANLDSWQTKVLLANYGSINQNKLNDYLYIQLFFSYAWALDYPNKKLIAKYKNQLREKLLKFNLFSLDK